MIGATRYRLERVGGRRRTVEGPDGEFLCVCKYLGPGEGGIDLIGEGGLLLGRVRGGTMPTPDYTAEMEAGFRARVYGIKPTLTLEAGEKRTLTEIRVEDVADGWRILVWLVDRRVEASLRHQPRTGGTPWSLLVSPGVDPLHALASLHAAERLLREGHG